MLAADGFLDSAGSRLEYRWIAPQRASAPSLVLLHEGLGCVALWKDFPDRLATVTGLGVLVYSRAGYSRSDPVTLPRPVSYMHYEAQVVLPEVLAAAGIEQPILLGHSDGASIALIYAGSDCGQPVQSLILLAPHVFNESVCIASIRQIGQLYRRSDLAQRLTRYHGEQVDQAFWGWHDVWLHADFWDWNIEVFLATIRAPILLLQGEQDEYGTCAHLSAIEQQVAGPVTQRLLPDCGHSPHQDQTQMCLDTIVDFLSKCL